MNAIKVSELNKYLKKHISMDYLLSDIEVEGEISNFKLHSNGNMYLSLKDEFSKINAMVYVMDTEGVDFKPKDGDKVLARGSVSLFEKDASIKLFIRSMKLKGLGDLHERYLKLKEKLFKEGLFDEEHKRKISYFPETIGVITSPTGAAVRDIINVLKRRNRSVNIIIYPSLVQGDGASEDLIKGIRYFNNNPVDTIIIGRGGGGYEDLFCFNDEELAREIYNSRIPVISAVGHEIDYVISDFASDLRAPTPSAAAELVSMSTEDLYNRLEQSFNRLNLETVKFLNEKKDALEIQGKYLNEYFDNEVSDRKVQLDNKYYLLNKTFRYKISLESNILEMTVRNLNKKRPDKLIEEKREKLNSIFKKIKISDNVFKKRKELDKARYFLDNNIRYLINEKKTQLSDLKELLKEPEKSTIFIKNSEGKILLKAEDAAVGDNISIIFNDGEISALVKKVVKEW